MENKNLNKLGIDIGSTTVKIAVLGKNNELLFADYERHFANIRETLTDLLKKAFDKLAVAHYHCAVGIYVYLYYLATVSYLVLCVCDALI